MDTKEQKDAAEFLGFLFDRIEQKLKLLSESGPQSGLRSLLDSLTVQISNSTTCQECSFRSERVESSQSLQVEVGGAAMQDKRTLEQVTYSLSLIYLLFLCLFFAMFTIFFTIRVLICFCAVSGRVNRWRTTHRWKYVLLFDMQKKSERAQTQLCQNLTSPSNCQP